MRRSYLMRHGPNYSGRRWAPNQDGVSRRRPSLDPTRSVRRRRSSPDARRRCTAGTPCPGAPVRVGMILLTRPGHWSLERVYARIYETYVQRTSYVAYYEYLRWYYEIGPYAREREREREWRDCMIFRAECRRPAAMTGGSNDTRGRRVARCAPRRTPYGAASGPPRVARRERARERAYPRMLPG